MSQLVADIVGAMVSAMAGAMDNAMVGINLFEHGYLYIGFFLLYNGYYIGLGPRVAHVYLHLVPYGFRPWVVPSALGWFTSGHALGADVPNPTPHPSTQLRP